MPGQSDFRGLRAGLRVDDSQSAGAVPDDGLAGPRDHTDIVGVVIKRDRPGRYEIGCAQRLRSAHAPRFVTCERPWNERNRTR